MKIAFAGLGIPKTGAYVVAVAEGREFSAAAKEADKLTKGQISRAVKTSKFTGKRHQFLNIVAPHGVECDRIVLMGIGKASELTEHQAEALGGNLFGHLGKSSDKTITVAIDGISGAKLGAASIAAHFAVGAQLRADRFDKYKTKEKAEDKWSVEHFHVLCDKSAAAKTAFTTLEKIADGVRLTRLLVNEPPNVIYPESFAAHAKQLTKLGVKVEVLDEKQLKSLGMGALLGVAQGSVRPARVVLMHYDGAGKAKGKKSGPIALIGKGVTFDTGGISIKPAGGMEEMKWDMAGAGAVTGAMMALAGRKAKVNVLGAVGLVENMPDGNAQRPSDIVKSYNGQTIEVLNTDAEGRLVLCDVMAYVQEKYKPHTMIDLATLTGAIVVALGSEFAGLFSNNDELAKNLSRAGDAVGEKLWRMPLAEAYDKEMEGFQSDLRNIGSGREAGSCTAAAFLGKFVEKGVAWAHLDIAGTAWSKKDHGAVPKGASAFGVRLLDRFIADHFE
jgi:leucyl aminopeptidase